MNFKHTPGPWTFLYRNSVREWWIGMSPSEGSVTYCGKSFGFDREQEEANARLIAAAPELLVACEGALAALLFAPHVDKQQAVDYLREVLAKVDGEKT